MASDFNDLIKRIKELPLKETRFNQQDYLEIVITGAQTKSLATALETFFGPPFKGTGSSLQSPDCKRFIEERGGIRENQTLYFLQTTDSIYYAMLWPWGDRSSITVKLEHCRRSP